MKSVGNVVFVWPEDYLLTGEELDGLKTDLAPSGRRVGDIIEEHGCNIEGSGWSLGPGEYAHEAVGLCKEAIAKTLGHLTCDQLKRNSAQLRKVINQCWQRDDLDIGRQTGIGSARGSLLNIAFMRMESEGFIKIGPNLEIEVTPKLKD